MVSDIPFLYASGSEFVEVYVGQGAKRVREVFAQVRISWRAVITFEIHLRHFLLLFRPGLYLHAYYSSTSWTPLEVEVGRLPSMILFYDFSIRF